MEVRDLEARGARHPVAISNYREPMVLSRDEHLPAAQIAHRVISAAVPVGKLGRRAAEGEPDELMPQADAEGGQALAREIAHVGQGVLYRRRIARAVRKEEPV